MNNIVFAFKKNQTNEVKKIMTSLLQAFTIKKKKELKQFLNLYMIRNCLKQSFWVSQKAYIMKICSKLASMAKTSWLSITLMEILEFIVAKKNIITNALWL